MKHTFRASLTAAAILTALPFSSAHAGSFQVDVGCRDGSAGSTSSLGPASTDVGGWQHGTSSRITRNLGCGGGAWNVYDAANWGNEMAPNGLSWANVPTNDRTSTWSFLAPGNVFRKSHTGSFDTQALSDAPFSNHAKITATNFGLYLRRNNDIKYKVALYDNLTSLPYGDTTANVERLYGCIDNATTTSGDPWSLAGPGSSESCSGDATSFLPQQSRAVPSDRDATDLTWIVQCPQADCTSTAASAGFLSISQQKRFTINETNGPELSAVTLPDNTWRNAASTKSENVLYTAKDLVGVDEAHVSIDGVGTIANDDNTDCANADGTTITNYTPCLLPGAITNSGQTYNQSADKGRIFSGRSVTASTASLPDGVYVGHLTATDSLGNTTVQDFPLRIDRTNPTIGARAANNLGRTITYNNVVDPLGPLATDKSGIDGATCVLNYRRPAGSGTYSQATGTYAAGTNSCSAIIPPAAGEGVFDTFLTVKDVAGNSATSSSSTTSVDTTAPTANIDNQTSRSIVATADDSGLGIASCVLSYRLQGSNGSFTDLATTYNATTKKCAANLPATTPSGTYEIRVVATDGAGLTASDIAVDVLSNNPPVANVNDQTSRNVVGTTSDSDGTIAACQLAYRLQGSSNSYTNVSTTYSAASGVCSATLPASLPAGMYQLKITGTDNNGATATDTAVVTVPNTPPVADIPDQNVRTVTGTASDVDGSITNCKIAYRAQGSSTPFIDITTTYDAQSKKCQATVPTNVVGTVELRITATDNTGATATDTAVDNLPNRAPIVDITTSGPSQIVANITDPDGDPIVQCVIRVRQQGSTGAYTTLDSVLNAGTCIAQIPSSVAGPIDIIVTGKDSKGAIGQDTSSYQVPQRPQCSDTVDNDGDGKIDAVDPNCLSGPNGTYNPNDDSEAPNGNEQLLACQTRKFILVDVYVASQNRVVLNGIAANKYIGKKIKIRSRWNGKVVATPIVQADNSFRVNVPLPPKNIARTNEARYQAYSGTDKSLDLKLYRRMTVSSLEVVTGGRVIMKGRLLGARPNYRLKSSRVYLTQRIGCGKAKKITSVQPSKYGSYRFSIPIPKGASSAVYRAQSVVLTHRTSTHLNKTYTLPRPITFKK